MHKRHRNISLYFDEQAYTTARYVIPFIEDVKPLDDKSRVLEVGCGLGGNLKPFLDLGCDVTGVDINPTLIDTAGKLLKNHQHAARLRLLCKDVYRCGPDELHNVDLIVMKDVIEHIHNQEHFMEFVKQFLKPDGLFFLAFPPWHMPFGGHQQVCESRFLTYLPYIHLLPENLYRSILRLFGEEESRIDELLEVKRTGITIERFGRAFDKAGYAVEREQLYLVNPNYEIKFGFRSRVQAHAISSIPYLRDFVTTCCYYLLRKAN